MARGNDENTASVFSDVVRAGAPRVDHSEIAHPRPTSPHLSSTDTEPGREVGSLLPASVLAERLQGALHGDPAAAAAARALSAAGGGVYVVGGAVRDALLGRTPHDLDLLCAALPAPEIERVLGELPGSLKLTGRQFGVYRYRTDGGYECEVALPRYEKSSGPGHRQFLIDARHDIPVADDLARRDFTVNAMAFAIDGGRLIDPFGGALDISRGELQPVSAHALRDDPLRSLRALVMVARFPLAPSTALLDAIRGQSLAEVSGERISLEWLKLLRAPSPGQGLALAAQSGLAAQLTPGAVRWAKMSSLWHEGLQAARQTPTRLLLAAEPLPAPERAAMISRLHRGSRRADSESRVARRLLELLREPLPQREPKWRNLRAQLGVTHRQDLLSFAEFLTLSPQYRKDPQTRMALQMLEETASDPVLVSDLALDGREIQRQGFEDKEIGGALRVLLDRVHHDPSLNNPASLNRILSELPR